MSKKLIAEADALRQNLMRDILAKRMLAYAALWKVFITYERNWLLSNGHQPHQPKTLKAAESEFQRLFSLRDRIFAGVSAPKQDQQTGCNRKYCEYRIDRR